MRKACKNIIMLTLSGATLGACINIKVEGDNNKIIIEQDGALLIEEEEHESGNYCIGSGPDRMCLV